MPILKDYFPGFHLLFQFYLLRHLSAVRSLLRKVQEVAKHLLLDCLSMKLRGVTLDDFVAGELLKPFKISLLDFRSNLHDSPLKNFLVLINFVIFGNPCSQALFDQPGFIFNLHLGLDESYLDPLLTVSSELLEILLQFTVFAIVGNQFLTYALKLLIFRHTNESFP